MPDTPPLPPGYRLETPPAPVDPLKPLLDAGVEPTNGFRTPEDIRRLRRDGYKPAANSLHLNGDAVDLLPGRSGMSYAALHEHARSIAAQWPGGRALNEGDHIHLQLPGWGMAPGTPGTPNSGLPALPSGYTLKQRGNLSAGNYRPGETAPIDQPVTGTVDGDTVVVAGGQHTRLWGVDAPESKQLGWDRSGNPVPIGEQSRQAITADLAAASAITGTPVGNSYGRTVAPVSVDGSDLGHIMVR